MATESGIQLIDTFRYSGGRYLDLRQGAATLSALRALGEGGVPEGFMAYCAETSEWYVWRSSHAADAETGRWRSLADDLPGGSGGTTAATERLGTADFGQTIEFEGFTSSYPTATMIPPGVTDYKVYVRSLDGRLVFLRDGVWHAYHADWRNRVESYEENVGSYARTDFWLKDLSTGKIYRYNAGGASRYKAGAGAPDWDTYSRKEVDDLISGVSGGGSSGGGQTVPTEDSLMTASDVEAAWAAALSVEC